ncbi:hypothetical protein TSUD_415160 [Trifolium subterraneum]|uniref:Endonuclease/exonuclease/phosphatase domain-containing protein n=1 Tax=Trifolium subterraneum TaxID=3900 RepID=A0A2Z6PUY3_TRISU|nr:hypothetical protein TSUD_415160 [Trifolium subterraneum]
MIEFQSWTDSFNPIHLPTRGVEFTWTNGRGGHRYTEKRLDRVVCNQFWLDLCNVNSVSTLTKHRSDHFPLLMEFQLTNVAFASHFKFMRMWTLHPDCRQLSQTAARASQRAQVSLAAFWLSELAARASQKAQDFLAAFWLSEVAARQSQEALATFWLSENAARGAV